MTKVPIQNLRDAISGVEGDFLAFAVNVNFGGEGVSRFVFEKQFYSTEIVNQMAQSDPVAFARLVLEYIKAKVRSNMIEGVETVDEIGSAGKLDGADGLHPHA